MCLSALVWLEASWNVVEADITSARKATDGPTHGILIDLPDITSLYISNLQRCSLEAA